MKGLAENAADWFLDLVVGRHGVGPDVEEEAAEEMIALLRAKDLVFCIRGAGKE